jgi:transposase
MSCTTKLRDIEKKIGKGELDRAREQFNRFRIEAHLAQTDLRPWKKRIAAIRSKLTPTNAA